MGRPAEAASERRRSFASRITTASAAGPRTTRHPRDLDWLGYVAPTAPVVRQSERDAIYREAVDGLRPRGSSTAVTARGAQILGGASKRRGAAYAGRAANAGCRSPMASAGACAWIRASRRSSTASSARRHRFRRSSAATADPRSARQLDVSVRGRRRRLPPGHRPGDPRRGPAAVDRPQIRLARLLGREHPPVFHHHPLIMKRPDQKLSKSDGDTGIRDLRAQGWTPEQVRAEARSLGRSSG